MQKAQMTHGNVPKPKSCGSSINSKPSGGGRQGPSTEKASMKGNIPRS